jgi:hypothetical protein
MAYQTNSYYEISSFGADALIASEALLKSYPLTKVCLDILGKNLIKTLEFGFFDPGFELIRQGEQGKDLYLLCNHLADVTVFDKVIVQMEAPALFGDKAIIDRNSTRNATISVAEGDQSLVIKIPMGQFLRDFKLSEFDDASFVQEMKIYYNLFLEIQNRLFKYSEIQKNVWDEVNKQLKLLNIQLLTAILNKQEERSWEPKVWQVIHQYLKAVHGFTWPDNHPYTVKTLVDVLKSLLENRYPRAKFRGNDQVFFYRKQVIWRRWLETLAELLIKVLASNQLPVNIGEVELFNPRIYQMRMHTLLVSIQRKFMFKKVAPREENYDSDKLKARNFFSRNQSENEFNLDAYLKTVNEMFVLKNPNRVLAQVAQQTAQLSATCENEFNASVSKMKHLLEKVKKLSKVNLDEDDVLNSARQTMDERIGVINQGFKAYNNRIVGHTYTYAGVIRFAEGKVPTVKDLMKSCASDVLKKNLTRAFGSILDQLALKPGEYSVDQLQELFYLCQGNSEDIIPETQLITHYWIPVSEGICLLKGRKNFGPVKPGSLLGGQAWEQEMNQEKAEESEEWQLKMPKKNPDRPLDDLFLILVIPKRKIPWSINSDPAPEEFANHYLPLLQWIVNKNLESLSLISELRDSLIKKYSQVIEVVVTEKKVREFESNANRLQQSQYGRILKLTYDILGITLEKEPAMSSEKLSRQIYNEIVKQTRHDFPKLNPEEQGNKAYTVWRFVQSEIVAKVFADEFEEKVKIEPPTSVFLAIKEDVANYLRDSGIEPPEGSYELTREGGEFKLAEIVQTDKTTSPKAALKVLISISDVVEQHLSYLVDESNTYIARLKQISAIRTEFDVNEIHSKFILDAIAKLQHILLTKFPDRESIAKTIA